MAQNGPTRKKPYLYGEIVEKIREMIRQGELGVGDKLPPERTLAERFKVSRNCIRQAVQTLAERKLLESRQGDGTYVCTPDESVWIDSLAVAIETQRELLGDIFEFRLIVEPQIASLAARHITREELDRLKVIVCDQQRLALAGTERSTLDTAFHLLLTEASRNRVLVQVMQAISGILDESRSEFLQSEVRRSASVVGHLKILDALEDRNPERAFQAMREHLTDVERILGGSGGDPTR